MNVLWITNTLLPEMSGYLTGNYEIKASGGWLEAMSSSLSDDVEINMYVATVSTNVKEIISYKGRKITYFVLPKKKSVGIGYDYSLESLWKEIKTQIQPDIVHIHGTEFPHGLAYVNSCGADNVVVSIQGMPSEIVKYCKGGLDNWTILKNITLRDLYMKNTIFHEYLNMKKMGHYENLLLGSVTHVIGRTHWDYVHTQSINPRIRYYKCNESLRSPFYEGTWAYDKCVPHSVFVSQLHCPLKGFHVLIKALAVVRQSYPDLQIRVAGWDIIRGNSLSDKIKLSGYAKILRKLIKRNCLEDCIVRVGQINASDMKNELLNANVYVCPSSIENSPNSLCEAQMLGTPCVASFVGGIPDFIKSEESGYLYRYEDYMMLAFYICKIFESKDIDTSTMRDIARCRHNKNTILKEIKSVYERMWNR